MEGVLARTSCLYGFGDGHPRLTLQEANRLRTQALDTPCSFVSEFSSGWSSVFGDLPSDQSLAGKQLFGDRPGEV